MASTRLTPLVVCLALPWGCPSPSSDFDGDGYDDVDDCQPTDPDVYPGATERCDDGLDNDCDGHTDLLDRDCNTQVSSRTDFVQVDCGAGYTCARDEDGAITCWGCEGFTGSAAALCSPPAGTGLDMALSSLFACALDDAGSITCWRSESALFSAPPGSYAAISAGVEHQCALDSGHRATCYGSSGHGELDTPDTPLLRTAEGLDFTCALRTDGTLTCWGCEDAEIPQACDPPEGVFTDVAAGWYHACALDAQGAVHCWGWDGYGQASPPAGSFVALAASMASTCAIDEQGGITCWGCDAPDVDERNCQPPQVDAEQIAVSDYSACALSSGHVICWGACLSGECRPP